MKTYRISEENVKGFMPKLLVQNTFDKFEAREVVVDTFAKFEISANLTKNIEEVMTWETLKPYVYNIIKGNVLPKSIKVVFALQREEMIELSENFSACFLNMNYENNEISFTTGTSSKTFTLSKDADKYFEEYIQKFFLESGIPAFEVDLH